MSSASINAKFAKAAADGRITGKEMKQILGEAAKGGLSADEKPALDRAMGRFKDRFNGDPKVELRQAFKDRSEALFNRFMRGGAKERREAYNHRLPSTKADAGNRLGKGRPREGKVFKVTGDPIVFDGTGKARGKLVSEGVKINYGQKKYINGEWHVYGFDFQMKRPGGSTQAASGWIPEKNIPSRQVREMGIIDALRAPDNKAHKFFQIAGAPPSLYPANAKIVKRPHPREGNQAPQDYLTRPGGVVNILFSTPGHGGVSNDTIVAGRGVKFVPSDLPSEKIVVYMPDGKGAYKDSGRRQEFVYGRTIADNGTSRYGWICKDNLKPV